MTSFRIGTPDIMTISGRFFEFLDPKPDQIHIEDIAHALSMTCRFSGHTRQFYSVAEHSVRVSRVCDPTDALHGLLHDAAEAYLTDLPRPIKRMLPQYKALEDKVQSAIYRRFGLDDATPQSVKRADGILLATEGRDLCAPGWEFWGLPEKPTIQKIQPWTSSEARDVFLGRFSELHSEVSTP